MLTILNSNFSELSSTVATNMSKAIDIWAQYVPDVLNLDISVQITQDTDRADCTIDSKPTDIQDVTSPGDHVYIRINNFYVSEPYIYLHELGHALGIITNPFRETIFAYYTYTQGDTSYFTGPNAVRVNNGPVPLTHDESLSHIGNFGDTKLLTDIMSGHPPTYDQAKITELDVAMIWDSRLKSQNEVLVNNLYDKVLHRMPDIAGFHYWIEQLDHGMSKSELAHAMVDGAQEKIDITGLLDFI